MLEEPTTAVTSGGDQYSELGEVWGTKGRTWKVLGHLLHRPPPPFPLLASRCLALEGPTFTVTSCLKHKSLFCFNLPVARRHLLYLFTAVAPAPNTWFDDNTDNDGTITIRARI